MSRCFQRSLLLMFNNRLYCTQKTTAATLSLQISPFLLQHVRKTLTCNAQHLKLQSITLLVNSSLPYGDQDQVTTNSHFQGNLSAHRLSTSSPGSFNFGNPHEFHLWLIKSGNEINRYLTNNLINSYAKTSELEDALKVFDELPEKNVVSWTCLISGFSQRSFPEEACGLFRSMLSSGIIPTQYTFGSVLQACQGLGLDGLKFGIQVHDFVWKTGYAFDSVVCNSLMSMYSTCSLDGVEEVFNVFRGMPKMHLISWNSILSICARKGEAIYAFELFSSLQKNDHSSCLRPDEYTFASLATSVSCSDTLPARNLFPSKIIVQILGSITKYGFLQHLYVGSALVSALARAGLLEEARLVFSEMPHRNVVSMNGLMVGLIKQKSGEAAVDVFREMNTSLETNSDCYTILLSACAEFSLEKEGRKRGREIHCVFIRNGGLNNYSVSVGNGLVNMYAKCGAINEAREVFEIMDVKDQVSWNSIITGFDRNFFFEDAVLHFQKMLRSNVMPSNFTLISTLSSCADLQFLRLGEQVYCVGTKSGLGSDVSVCNCLLNLYGECGCISECWKVFNNMRGHDLISWNSMIGLLADIEGSRPGALDVFLDMIQDGWVPNRVSFVNVLAAVSSLSVQLSNQIHALIRKCGFSGDVTLENALLSCYAKSGDMTSCENMFSDMLDRRDIVSWNSMISGYIHNEHYTKAMDIIWLMMHSGQKIDSFTLSTTLSVCSSISALEHGMYLHGVGLRSLLGFDVVVGSALVDMYSKCGRVDYASKVFAFMPLKNKFTWNSMISGYARNGHAGKALQTFKNMELAECQPDHISFVGVLSACSHAGLVEEGLHHFHSMSEKYGVVQKMEHYSCIVDLLGRAGRLGKMQEFLNKMPMQPNALVWRTVLGACCRMKDDGSGTALGEKASEMLLELEPQNPVNYVLLSHMYAARGRWEDVMKARTSMRGTSARKEAGSSWVTMRDGLHVFHAGDRSHPETEDIYAKLRELNQRIREAGYVPQTDFALYDLEAESKEELLSYHSEKITVAFVLSRGSSRLPIRIMKNLRVCGDCHLAFLYISKVVKRRIILRDSCRFHHFEDGNCSCGDYW